MKKLFFLCMFLSGCSAFHDKNQTLEIATTVSDASITVNDKFVGNGSVRIDVPRDKSVTVEAHKPGYETTTRFIQTVPSLTGKLDTAGTYFLFPAIGLFTPGASELETTKIFLNMKKQ